MIDRITLITSNQGKAREYAALLGVDLDAVNEDLVEIQSLDVREVVAAKAKDAYTKVQRPVLVDDTGMSLRAWNGLPGALVKWFLSTVETQGILDMATGLVDRAATVTVALGYADAHGVRVFTGEATGRLATERRGDAGFGYDEIFEPDGSRLTYAEMSPDEKNATSHRRIAVDELRAWLASGDGPDGPAQHPAATR